MNKVLANVFLLLGLVFGFFLLANADAIVRDEFQTLIMFGPGVSVLLTSLGFYYLNRAKTTDLEMKVEQLEREVERLS